CVSKCNYSEVSMAATFARLLLGRTSVLTAVMPKILTIRSLGDFSGLGKLNHVAIAVPDLEKATSLYRDVLQAPVSDVDLLPEHGVKVVFVNLPNTKIELLHPLGENSPISAFLEKNKSGGIHHICIEVENIKDAMGTLMAKNIRLLSEEPKIGAHGKPVVFCHPKDCGGVLLELEEL
uniref:Methylmalonyl-CoA epimerase, mitochondrial n=2 Tax=Ciona intestinalis TaxID=7719 RepID=H2XQG7_CIOIN